MAASRRSGEQIVLAIDCGSSDLPLSLAVVDLESSIGKAAFDEFFLRKSVVDGACKLRRLADLMFVTIEYPAASPRRPTPAWDTEAN